MNYETFKAIVADRIKDFLPEQYGDYEIRIQSVRKVNQKLDSLSLVPPEGKRAAVPSLYLNELYEEYLTGGDLNKVLLHTAETIEKGFQQAKTMGLGEMDLRKPEEHLVMMLVNTEQNKQLLKEVPNQPYQDLSIIYRWVVNSTLEGMSSFIVTNQLMEQLELSQKQIQQMAVENTKRMFPPTVRTMEEVIVGMIAEEGMPEELEQVMSNEDSSMYVISNAQGINGAVSMLYEETLHKVAEKIGGDIYILPSSTHEVLAVPAGGDPNELAEMVRGINQTQVAIEEQLSNQVYYYDKDLRTLSLATDTPYKELSRQENEAINAMKMEEASRANWERLLSVDAEPEDEWELEL
ncbi:DUF5688 family protein [Anaeromicropila populeti]|uniref:Uncharacterized protein n=1 Tax=Anaeromicropila populeti TaxID=37658 RepID=A0A1I6JEN0_9FIRM|nr:DUF5688 family protein [Anaeromicropila populeti]SFR77483.1 hypothetical protein SAMN05661086_01623 [Anaeromicropila populeti]